MTPPVIWLTDSPGFGGSEINLLRVLRFTASRPAVLAHGTDLTREFASAIAETGVRTTTVDTHARVRAFPRSLAAAVRLMTSFPRSPIVLWSHYTDSNRWAALAFAATGRPYIVVEQYVPSDRLEFTASRTSIPLKRWTGGTARKVILNAYSQQDHYRKLFRTTGRNIDVIPNSRPVSEIANRVKTLRNDKESLRRGLDLPLDRPVVVCVARLTAVKDQISLIRAWSLVTSDAILVLVGDGPERGRWEREADPLGDRIRFAGHQTDPIPWLAAADVFVLPSVAEGLPGALIEAMAAGLPCVTTDIPGNRELVEDAVTGLIVPVRTPDALVNALNRLLTDPKFANELAGAAYRRVAKEYDEAAEAAAWVRLLHRLGGR